MTFQLTRVSLTNKSQECLGCDGVPNSGLTVDSCGECGGGDSTCDDPYNLTVSPTSCMSVDGIRFRVDVAWSGPSNHSLMDKIAIYGPQSLSAVGDEPWSGQCVGQGVSPGTLQHCASDSGCPSTSSCSKLWDVPAGQSSGSVTLLGTKVAAIGTPFQARIKYLRCLGPVEEGLCTRGYQVASQVIVTSPLPQDVLCPFFHFFLILLPKP